MGKLFSLARETTSTTGTGTVTLTGAVNQCLTFALAGVSNGEIVPYGISDGVNGEVGIGTVTISGTTTMTRSVTKSTNSDAAINLSGNAEVYITPRAEDLTFAWGQCVLKKVSSNIVLLPCNGNLLTINGAHFAVPDAGVSLAPTGLTPNTSYYVYAYMSSGTMTLEASTTAHATSTTAGNKGVEIKSGDDTRSLVGMVRPITGPAFADTILQRFVRSWFNDVKHTLIGDAVSTTRTTTSPTLAEIHSELRIEFLGWLNEVVSFKSAGTVFNSANFYSIYTIGLNGNSVYLPTSGAYNTNGGATDKSGDLLITSEGYNYGTLLGAATGGSTAYFYIGVGVLGGCRIMALLNGR